MRPFILQIWPVAACLSPGCLKSRLGLLCCNSLARAPTARRTLLRPHLCIPSPRVFPTSGGGRLFPLALDAGVSPDSVCLRSHSSENWTGWDPLACSPLLPAAPALRADAVKRSPRGPGGRKAALRPLCSRPGRVTLSGVPSSVFPGCTMEGRGRALGTKSPGAAQLSAGLWSWAGSASGEPGLE